ncbi:MAG: hypothetical protein ACYTEX_10990 [Planctomycetota bacterium]|jgi:Zn finger protein HypA/HybF involved in hydrogenase expression
MGEKKIVKRDCGYHQCEDCGRVEEKEQEVRCWECGGIMVWVAHPTLVLVQTEAESGE